jgi:DNA mismatch endonuclease, patch repair protein
MTTTEQRRKNMQAIRSKNTKIELILRKALFAKGYRYRKNYSKVFGNPDIVFAKLKIAIFCDSEFWHGYDWENRKKDIKSNKDFWFAKIDSNIKRDCAVNEHLISNDYIVLRFWAKRIEKNLDGVINEIEQAIASRKTSH